MSATADRSAAPRVRVIKRYANRKLYDTRDSRYVTLLQIAEHVRAGEEVSIIDNTTKEDLTNVTLAQIVYEEERKSGEEARRSSPTLGTLRGLIQNSSERLMTSLRDGPMGKLIPGSREGEAEVEAPPPPPPTTVEAAGKDKKGRIMTPKEALEELQRLADDRIRGLLGIAIGNVQQLQGEVRRLQGRIEELEQKLVAAQRRRDENPKDSEEESDTSPT